MKNFIAQRNHCFATRWLHKATKYKIILLYTVRMAKQLLRCAIKFLKFMFCIKKFIMEFGQVTVSCIQQSIVDELDYENVQKSLIRDMTKFIFGLRSNTNKYIFHNFFVSLLP